MKQAQKILSIIVPTYNMEKYMAKCLQSLIIRNKELFKLVEVIVIIDGATDRSSQIAHVFQSQYPEMFSVVDKKNGNYGSCVNCGLQLATAKYIKVLDADDSFDTANFEDYLLWLSNMDVDMIVTPYSIVDESGKIQSFESYDLPVNRHLTWQYLTPAFKKKSLQMHAVTYKRQNLIDIHYRQTEGISYTDQEWVFYPLVAVHSARYYPDTIYKYLIGREGQTISHENFKRSLSHNEQCCRRIISEYDSTRLEDCFQREFLDYKCRQTLRSMYFWYLLRYPDLDLNPLVRFDDFVCNVNPALMIVLDESIIPHTNYHFIRQWHINRQKRPRYSSIYYFYSRCVDKLIWWKKRLCGKSC